METISVVEARRRFSELVSRVSYGGVRVIVERHGKPTAALVSVTDLERLEALERGLANARESDMLALARARTLRASILAERGGELVPDSGSLLSEPREERVAEPSQPVVSSPSPAQHSVAREHQAVQARTRLDPTDFGED